MVFVSRAVAASSRARRVLNRPSGRSSQLPWPRFRPHYGLRPLSLLLLPLAGGAFLVLLLEYCRREIPAERLAIKLFVRSGNHFVKGQPSAFREEHVADAQVQPVGMTGSLVVTPERRLEPGNEPGGALAFGLCRKDREFVSAQSSDEVR